MESYRDISDELWEKIVLLVIHQQYFGHIHDKFPPERLLEHMEKVCRTACILVEQHSLDGVIDRLLSDVFKKVEQSEIKGRLVDFGKRLFVASCLCHDFGKVNENFQVDRMLNTKWFEHKKSSLEPPFGHSFLGTYLFVSLFVSEIAKEGKSLSDQVKNWMVALTFFFGYVIYRHHAADWKKLTSEKYLKEFFGKYDELQEYLKSWQIEVNPKMQESIFKCIVNISEQFKRECSIGFPLYALLKLNSSLLTASDYLATHEYMTGEPVRDMGVFNDRERVEEIIKYFRGFEHNKIVYSQQGNFEPTCPQQKSKENLNHLRKEMAIEIIRTIRANIDKRLFYIEAPTGGGKTNMSMIAVTELLAMHGDINKVFYVFPFTTLITQTYSSLKKSMGLTAMELAELHSKAALHDKMEGKEDGLYGDKKKDYIDHLFALYPVTVLSHVKFFDILKTNQKESNYLLHRLSNSIVVIDELQSYNPKIWDKMLYFISQYAYYFNIRFVIMSATLPKIGLLSSVPLPEKVEFVDLLPHARDYLTNPNFAQRVNFRFDYFEQEVEIPFLMDKVIEKSIEYARIKSKTKSVHTIIEFIFKKSASDFYRLLSRMEHPFDEVFVLSGTILESRRKEIINILKSKVSREKNILLITTQVVEAGVDIDMDLGFKNISLIDSDEQLAGRVDRNASKEGCEVYLFRLDEAKVLYAGDKRYEVTRNSISMDDYKAILREKDFGKLYSLVLHNIDEWNSTSFVENFQTAFLRDGISCLDYEEVGKRFKIINQQNVSIYVPMRIPVKIVSIEAGKEENIFSTNELEFLALFDVHEADGMINGADVWRIYEQSVLSRSENFDLEKLVHFKMLQSIMSKFSFSLLYMSKDYKQLLCGVGEEKYGYFYFSHWDNEGMNGVLYGYEFGLNSDAFEDIGII